MKHAPPSYAVVCAKVIRLLAGLSEDDRARAVASLGVMFVPTPSSGPSSKGAGAARQARYRERRRHGDVTDGVTRDVTDGVTRDVTDGVTRDVTPSPSLDSPSPSPSDSRDLEALSPEATGEVTDGAGAEAAPKPVNHFVLVEHFVAGVHGAGAHMYPLPRGGELRALGEALALHAEREPGRWLEVVRALGGRWVAYCGGAPRGGLKAKDWLGEGAPIATLARGGGRGPVRVVQPPPPEGPRYKIGDGS